MDLLEVKNFLDDQVTRFNDPSFIEGDPISIPHSFSQQQDIEIIGLWTAVLSWGLRKTIIKKARELCVYMDHQPFEFVMHHSHADLKGILNFKHRTFNDTDTLCFLSFFKWYYTTYESLQDAFIRYDENGNFSIKEGICNFHNMFKSAPDFISRTKKHVSTPANNSTCKRLNMFLRWMVRSDKNGVDFGIWKRIPVRSLMIPLDIHVFRVASRLGLISRHKPDWKTVEELTEVLRSFDPEDPVKYDYALFSLGVWKSIL